MSAPIDQYQVYAEFGIAAEKAQILEVAAGNVALSFLAIFVNPDHISIEQRELFRSMVYDLNQKTLGRLLRSIKNLATFDQSIFQTVDEALERRNYLTHHFFRTHNFAFFDPAGRELMIRELKDIQRKLVL